MRRLGVKSAPSERKCYLAMVLIRKRHSLIRVAQERLAERADSHRRLQDAECRESPTVECKGGLADDVLTELKLM